MRLTIKCRTSHWSILNPVGSRVDRSKGCNVDFYRYLDCCESATDTEDIAHWQSAIIESTSNTWWLWALGKFIGGIGIGSVQASLPVVSLELL